MKPYRVLAAAALALAVLFPAPTRAQDDAASRVAALRAEPEALTLASGERARLEVVAVDADGNVVEGIQFRMFGRGVRVENGEVVAGRGGDFQVFVTAVFPPGTDRRPPTLVVPVHVDWPPIATVEVRALDEGRLYAGTRLRHTARALHADGSERPRPELAWTSSDPSVASVDRFGMVSAHAPGRVVIRAGAEGATGELTYEVAPLPVARLEIRGGLDRARQGDVLTFQAVALAEDGSTVDDVPVDWSVSFVPDDTIHAPGAAGIVDHGKFVGEVPGVYTIVATAGPNVARRTVDVRPRDVVQEIELVGHGSVNTVHTSDLWIFEGVDGRDYAVTGTWGGDGWAYFWDVTDPAAIRRTDSIQVDARTVNDVKVSPDGRYAAISREGASNRRNGVVILDLSDPAHPEIASVYDEGLTGGVHNMFATNDYLFALSGGDKYVILDVTDIRNPRYVSEYNHPDSRIHDVWVHDGIAYSSEWGTGVVVVDVGNGRWGGSIENPVFVTNVPYPVGATHAAFPYAQESTGKFYLFLGDEIMSRQGAAWSGAGLSRIPQQGGTPSVTSGYIHIIDFTDPENPRDVARYEVREFGTHNLWVEDDVLYQAYYEGGMRMVDVSGELLGNLAEQGREIAVFKSFDPNGYVANAPMVWGGQPYKGHIFFSDFNSGLWAVKLKPKGRPIS
ncbi:MAG: hypothetical protein D6701_14105 [Gemmatimonadetes bacterium]|nr:MAG: hypothetical protein D6701_14105 [Gemmatimonadota bacterium]